MSLLHTWAIQWGVPANALQDLQLKMGLIGTTLEHGCHGDAASGSEAFAQSQVRLEASVKGMRLFRNNVGALKTEEGRMVRFGLANDSAQVNKVIKSADLIGIRPVVIQPEYVGRTFGIFLSREMKEPGWKYTGTEREVAQLAWVNLINSMGGDAGFATGKGTL